MDGWLKDTSIMEVFMEESVLPLLTKVRLAALRISVLGPSPCPYCGQYCGVWPEASFISASQEPPESLAPSPNV